MTTVNLMFTGDINLMNVIDPLLPFRAVMPRLHQADALLGNLECCLYQPLSDTSVANEGFYADPSAGQALKAAGFAAVGNANNVNYGSDAIRSTLEELKKLGIPSTGAGLNRAQARAPVVFERSGLRIGFIQRTSVYWPTNHEASDSTPGVAALRGHTAYQLPLHKTRQEIPPANRPGVPPIIVTWADKQYLVDYLKELTALRARVDILVASHHWGLHEEVLDYMPEIAHAAVDAGADVVIGHGPHYSLPVELYKGKPVFYGLGSFSFHTGHGGRKHGDWLGMLACVQWADGRIREASFEFVRHNEANETVLCNPASEASAVAALDARSRRFDTALRVDGQRVVAEPA
jgi:poly-gamma-glutamate capsule biosynthesis protein CapA/YwtB (metallophosphatase superfamily)